MKDEVKCSINIKEKNLSTFTKDTEVFLTLSTGPFNTYGVTLINGEIDLKILLKSLKDMTAFIESSGVKKPLSESVMKFKTEKAIRLIDKINNLTFSERLVLLITGDINRVINNIETIIFDEE